MTLNSKISFKLSTERFEGISKTYKDIFAEDLKKESLYRKIFILGYKTLLIQINKDLETAQNNLMKEK